MLGFKEGEEGGSEEK